jgi:hypothetical protein
MFGNPAMGTALAWRLFGLVEPPLVEARGFAREQHLEAR